MCPTTLHQTTTSALCKSRYSYTGELSCVRPYHDFTPNLTSYIKLILYTSWPVAPGLPSQITVLHIGFSRGPVFFLVFRSGTDLISLLIELFLFSSCWGDALQKSIKLRRFKWDRDEILQTSSSSKYASYRLAEWDFWYDVGLILSRRRS